MDMVCTHCNGTGTSPTTGEDCHICDAVGTIPVEGDSRIQNRFVVANNERLVDLTDKVDDVLGKCEDILEKLNE